MNEGKEGLAEVFDDQKAAFASIQVKNSHPFDFAWNFDMILDPYNVFEKQSKENDESFVKVEVVG